MDIQKNLVTKTIAELIYNQKLLQQTAKDLINKNYLPERFAYHLKKDPQIWQASMHNFFMEPFKEFFCPHCQISIKAPKEWVKQHIKTHFRDDSKKENEMLIAKVNPYRF